MVRRWLRHILAKSSKVFTYLVVSTNWALGAVACKLSTTREKNENKCLYPECIQGFYIENVDSERLDTQSGDKQRYDTITMSRETVESPDEIWRADVAANSVHPWLTGSLQRGDCSSSHVGRTLIGARGMRADARRAPPLQVHSSNHKAALLNWHPHTALFVTPVTTKTN